MSLSALLDMAGFFMLVLVRLTGMFVVAPFFGRRNIPAIFKAGFAFVNALIAVSVLKDRTIPETNGIVQFVAAAGSEFIVGMLIGYVSYMIFSAIYLAGQLIDMQMGFGIVNVIDPLSNIQVPVTANFYYIMTMLVFLLINGHHALIEALHRSFEIIPVGRAVFSDILFTDVLRMFGYIFELGFKFAAPVTAAILIVDVMLGIMSKTVPQLNVFVVGMPAKILIGFLVMIITVPAVVLFMSSINDLAKAETIKFIRDMSQP